MRRIQITLRDFVGRVLRTALGHHAAVRAQTVDVAIAHERLADPHHAILHGQRHEILQGGELVATEARRHGEAASDFVFPSAGEPLFAGGIGEFLELPAGHAHICRAAHDDGVCRVERGPLRISHIAICINRHQISARALGYELRHTLGVTVT